MAESPATLLRNLLGPDVPREALMNLLRQCSPRGDVNAAADLYFATGGTDVVLTPQQAAIQHLRELGVTGTDAAITQRLEDVQWNVQVAYERWSREQEQRQADGPRRSGARDEDTEMEDAEDHPPAAPAAPLSPGDPRLMRPARGGDRANDADDENDSMTQRGQKPGRSVHRPQSPRSLAAALNVLPRLQAPRPQASPPRHQASSRRHQASPPRREASPQRAKSAPQSPTSDDFTYTDSEPEEQAEEPAANGDHAQDPQNLPSGWIRGRHQGMPYMSSELPGTDAVWKKAVEANNENRRTWSDQPGSQEETTLSLPDITNAKLRQPRTYPRKMKLPFRDLRDADGRLHCTNPEKVPKTPASPRKAKDYDEGGADFVFTERDDVELGVFHLSILPTGSKAVPGEARKIRTMKDWHNTPVADNQRKINEVVLPLLLSGVLPLLSLELVGGGKYKEKVVENCYRRQQKEPEKHWSSDVERVAVAVLEGSLGYEELYEAWVAAGLTVHTCQESGLWSMTLDQLVSAQPRTNCLVLGYVAPEFMRALRALAVLSPMPLNLTKSLDASNYFPCATKATAQEGFATVHVTSYLGVRMGEQPDLYETDEDSDGPEMKKKRGPVKKKPKTVYLTLPMARAAHAQTKAAAGSGASSAAQASGPPSGVKSRVSGAASNSAPSLGAAAGPSDARTPGTGQKKRKRPEASSAAKPSREERGKASAGQKRGSGKKSAPQPAADPAKPEKPVQMTGVLPMELTVDFAMGDFIRIQRLSARKFKADHNKEVQPFGVYEKGPDTRLKLISKAFADLVHTLLTCGSGLYLGPDCDGQLNLCDSTHSGPSAVSGTESSKPKDKGVYSLGERICGLSMEDWASMAKSQYERLSAVWEHCWKNKYQALIPQHNAIKSKVCTDFPDVYNRYKSGDSESAGTMDTPLVKALLNLDSILSWTYGKQREAEISLELAWRVWEAFHVAGLCEEGPPPRPPAAGPSVKDNTGAAPAKTRTPLHERPVLPLTSALHVGFILAAERASGVRILKRDARGWIARVRCEKGTGGLHGWSTLNPETPRNRPQDGDFSQGELPKSEFGVHKLLDTVNLPADYPTAPAPACLQTKPKPFQLQGLAFLLAREQKRDAVDRGLLQLHPFWLQLVTKKGYIFYLNRLQGYTVSKRFAPATGAQETEGGRGGGQDTAAAGPAESSQPSSIVAKPPAGFRPRATQGSDEKRDASDTVGGFLCDEMGVGKTLECLMLIVSNPAPADLVTEGPDHKVLKTGESVPIRTTLVIVPASLIDQWQDEVRKHLKPRSVRWGVFQPVDEILAPEEPPSDVIKLPESAPNGTRMTRRSSGAAAQAKAKSGPQREKFLELWEQDNRGRMVPISELDIVFITYEQLQKDKMRKSPLRDYGFWRIILDEAQMVGDLSSVAAEVAGELFRFQAWVVTGTPINKTLSELNGLINFLGYKPFCLPFFWGPNLHGLYEAHTAAGLAAMRSLLRGVMLRRTKAQVAKQLSLPPCVHEDRGIIMGDKQRNLYDQLAGDFRSTMKQLREQRVNPAHQFGVYARAANPSTAMRILTSLRQACCHVGIVKLDRKEKARTKASLREAVSELVLQVNTALDEAVAKHCHQRLLDETLELVLSKVPGVGPLLQVLVDVQASVQLAEMYDIRDAITHRNPGGFANIQGPLAQKAVREIMERVNKGVKILTAGKALPRDFAVFMDPQQPLTEPYAPAFTVARIAPDHPAHAALAAFEQQRAAAMASPDAAPAAAPNVQPEADAGAPQLVINLPFGGTGEKRPFGALPEIVFAYPVVAVPTDIPDDPELAAVLRESAQEELDDEITKTLSRRHDRRNYWLRIEYAVMVLCVFVMRNNMPECVELAALINEAAAARAEGVPFESVWASEPDDLDCMAAVFMWGLQQRINELRLELGLPPVPDAPPNWAGEQGAARQGQGAPAARRHRNVPMSFNTERGMDRFLRGEETVKQFEAFRKAVLADASHARSCLEHNNKLIKEALGMFNFRLGEEIKKLNPQAPANNAPPAQGPQGGGGGGEGGGDADGQSGPPADSASHADEPRMPPLKLTEASKAIIAAALAARESASKEEECPVCYDGMESRAYTECGHCFCLSCLQLTPLNKNGVKPCPACREPLNMEKIREVLSPAEAARRALERARERQEDFKYGSKIEALLLELEAMKVMHPGSKSIVVSSWPELLNVVQEAFKEHKVEYADFTLKDQTARAQQLKKFKESADVRVLVMLLSHSSGAAGLTLTEASTVFILEPTMEPGLEAQVAARIHRLGQTKQTRVIRIVADKSVEQYVISYQQSLMAADSRKQHEAAQQQKPEDGAAAGGAAGEGAAGAAAGGAAGAAANTAQVNNQEPVEVFANDNVDMHTLFRYFRNV